MAQEKNQASKDNSPGSASYRIRRSNLDAFADEIECHNGNTLYHLRISSGSDHHVKQWFNNHFASNTLLVSYPSSMKGHIDIMTQLPEIICEAENIFMFIPQDIRNSSHSKIIDETRRAIAQNYSAAIDLTYPSENGVYHNILGIKKRVYDMIKSLAQHHTHTVNREVEQGRKFIRFLNNPGLFYPIS